MFFHKWFRFVQIKKRYLNLCTLPTAKNCQNTDFEIYIALLLVGLMLDLTREVHEVKGYNLYKSIYFLKSTF